MRKKITIEGIDCLMSSGVHQSSGDIFFSKDPGKSTYYIDDMFTLEEARKLVAYFTKKHWSANHSSSTDFAGWGSRVSLISVYMSSEAIEEAFVDYYNKKMNK